jgi:hypothetical protein
MVKPRLDAGCQVSHENFRELARAGPLAPHKRDLERLASSRLAFVDSPVALRRCFPSFAVHGFCILPQMARSVLHGAWGAPELQCNALDRQTSPGKIENSLVLFSLPGFGEIGTHGSFNSTEGYFSCPDVSPSLRWTSLDFPLVYERAKYRWFSCWEPFLDCRGDSGLSPLLRDGLDICTSNPGYVATAAANDINKS